MAALSNWDTSTQFVSMQPGMNLTSALSRPVPEYFSPPKIEVTSVEQLPESHAAFPCVHVSDTSAAHSLTRVRQLKLARRNSP